MLRFPVHLHGSFSIGILAIMLPDALSTMDLEGV